VFAVSINSKTLTWFQVTKLYNGNNIIVVEILSYLTKQETCLRDLSKSFQLIFASQICFKINTSLSATHRIDQNINSRKYME